jgi:hypothetical protein
MPRLTVISAPVRSPVVGRWEVGGVKGAAREAPGPAQAIRNDVFISYARED